MYSIKLYARKCLHFKKVIELDLFLQFLIIFHNFLLDGALKN